MSAEIHNHIILTILLPGTVENRCNLPLWRNPRSVKIMKIFHRRSEFTTGDLRARYRARYCSLTGRRNSMTGCTVMFIVLLFVTTAGSLSGEEPEQTGSPFAFSGAVSRHEDFQYDLPGGLVFTLEFIEYGPEGWAVRIFDPDFPSDNFCAVVTPPYRGINALQIYAWHFFNEDGTGPNDGSVNAPGEERRFFFVTDKSSYDTAFESLSTMLWPESTEAQEAASDLHDGIHRESGILIIREFVPGYAGGDSAWLDSMEFDVELFVPEWN